MAFFISVCTNCQDFDWHGASRDSSANSRACLRAWVNCERIYTVIWCCSVTLCCCVLCIAKNSRSNTRSCDELLKSTPSNSTRRCKSLSALKENISGVVEVLFLILNLKFILMSCSHPRLSPVLHLKWRKLTIQLWLNCMQPINFWVITANFTLQKYIQISFNNIWQILAKYSSLNLPLRHAIMVSLIYTYRPESLEIFPLIVRRRLSLGNWLWLKNHSWN